MACAAPSGCLELCGLGIQPGDQFKIPKTFLLYNRTQSTEKLQVKEGLGFLVAH